MTRNEKNIRYLYTNLRHVKIPWCKFVYRCLKRNDIEIQNSYKCSKRKPWYAVPIVRSGSVVFLNDMTYARECLQILQRFIQQI